MNYDEFFLCGKVVKLYGSSGELVLTLDTKKIAGKKKMESVFIQLQGNLIPFFIDHIHMKASNQAQIKLLDINSSDEAASLLGCKVFLPNSFLAKKMINNDYILVGYRVLDQNHGEIGKVINVLELPMQDLLEIDFNGKQILVPLVEAIIERVDKKDKILYINAPEGLIEIYL